jgi:hypothetical protein
MERYVPERVTNVKAVSLAQGRGLVGLESPDLRL